MLENNCSVFFGNQIQTSAQQTDPDTFLTILISEIHIIVTDRIWILGIIFIAGKAQAMRRIHVRLGFDKPVSFGRKPQVPFFILHYMIYGAYQIVLISKNLFYLSIAIQAV